MKIDYQIVVDQEGNPQSALLSWEDFQEIRKQLNIGEAEITGGVEPLQLDLESDAEPEIPESTEPPAEYRSGGDYKPLKEIGVNLPNSLNRKVVPSDAPAIPEEEEQKIKLGKRIR